MNFKYLIKTAMIALAPLIFLPGCGAITDAFQSSEETSDNKITLVKNTLSIVYVPSTGQSGTPPSYDDFNSTDLAPATVEFKIVKYPQFGNLIFSANMAVYKPRYNYIGADFYAFEVYDLYED